MNKNTKPSKALVKTAVSKSVTDKEFRIGNLINYRIVDKMDERKEWLEVSEIDYDDLRIFGIKHEMNQDYQPIEINEDWLMKFGFEKIIDNEFTLRYELKKDPRFDYFFPKHNLKTFGLRFQGCTFFDVVKYVHQLQNFYFALTGRELTVC
jgi:hypothetical protein